MNNKKEFNPKPVAQEYLIKTGSESYFQFMSDMDILSFSSHHYLDKLTRIENRIDYWSHEDMMMLVKNYKVDSNIIYPEHCYDYCSVGVSGDKEIILAYIDNSTIPYVRMDKTTKGQMSYFKYFGTNIMVEHLSSLPIVGYGFPAYLALHSRIGSHDVQLLSGKYSCLGFLVRQYCKHRYELYRSINSMDYRWIDVNINSKYDGAEAQKRKSKLYKAFFQRLLKQEKDNYKKSAELLSLFNGELNVNVEMFIGSVQASLKEIGTKKKISTSKRNIRKPQVGDIFYLITTFGTIQSYQWDGSPACQEMLKIGNVFQTKEEASLALDKIKSFFH